MGWYTHYQITIELNKFKDLFPVQEFLDDLADGRDDFRVAYKGDTEIVVDMVIKRGGYGALKYIVNSFSEKFQDHFLCIKGTVRGEDDQFMFQENYQPVSQIIVTPEIRELAISFMKLSL